MKKITNPTQKQEISVLEKLGYKHISEVNIDEIKKSTKLTADEILELEAENFFYRYRKR